tara:strand:+ start:3456 stop:3851 length:396 start_codon:yes stop_codon:yes gene_type:complete
MLKLKSLLKNKTVVFTLKIAVVLVVCYLAFYTFRQCEGYANVNGKNLIYISMEGCPHCVSFTPQWESAKSQNKTNIVMTDHERGSKKGIELCKKHNVTGFPAILLLDGGKKEVYKGKRTTGGILDFLKSLK